MSEISELRGLLADLPKKNKISEKTFGIARGYEKVGHNRLLIRIKRIIKRRIYDILAKKI